MNCPAGLIVPAALLSLVAFTCSCAAEPIELVKALQGGSIRLTLTAKDGGKNVDLTVENTTEGTITVLIRKGKTPINLPDRLVFLVCSEPRKIPLARNGRVAASLPIEQEGQGTWTSGSVTLEQNKPSKSK